MNVQRRTVLARALGASALVAAPAILRAQTGPMQIGFLTVKTGPLASGGIQMEQGLTLYLKERNNMLAGRPVQLFTGDSRRRARGRAHQDAGVGRARQHLLPDRPARDRRGARDRRLHPRQADPDAQRRRRRGHDPAQGEPVVLRATSTSAQCSYPMGDYAAKELKYKRVAMIADDIAYGHELNAGFQRAFEDAGGKVVQKLWPPLNAPDYGTYIAQLKTNVDAIFIGFAGSNGFKFLRQYKEYGGKIAAARRHDGDRRVAAAADGRRGDRHALDLLVLGAARQRRPTRSSSTACSATTRSIPASMRPRPTPTARCSRPR